MRAFIRFSSSAPTGAVVKKELLDANEPIKKLKIDGGNLGAPQGCQLAVVSCGVSELQYPTVAAGLSICNPLFNVTLPVPFYQL